MATNIIYFQRYIAFTALMLFFDLVLIKASQMIRQPFYKTIYRILKREKVFIEGYPPLSALQWIRSDIGLLIILGLFYFYGFESISAWVISNFTPKNVPIISSEILLGGILIFSGVMDYWLNRAFYFGGTQSLKERNNVRRSWREHKFVFVCSPLSPPTDEELLSSVTQTHQAELDQITNTTDKDQEIKSLVEKLKEEKLRKNINLAQEYCFDLMEDKSWLKMLKRKITPFASHCFYTYFLDDKNDKDRDIGRQCALSFLAACDAIYIYTSDGKKNENDITRGMGQERNNACKLGLEILYKEAKGSPAVTPPWHTNSFEVPSKSVEHEIFFEGKTYKFNHVFRHPEKESERPSKFESNVIRKRVYVCTHLRGIPILQDGVITPFSELTPEGQKAILEANVKKTLWQCYELARDDEAFVAPFAPQAFFPYFWKFYQDGKFIKERFARWFESSIRVLEVCDAVYVYTKDGLPDSRYMSEGMKIVENLAESLGLEIIYKKEEPTPNGWAPASPSFF